MIFSRGLAALIITLHFSTTLFAEFLYKDDIVNNPRFSEQIEAIGSELKEKTGTSLYLIMLKDLDENQTIVDYELSLSNELSEPYVLLTFVELQKKVDILARPVSLYNDFDKKQVLSPNASFFGAIASVIIFARDWKSVKEITGNYGGTILPLLAGKAKGDDIVKKYSVALFNGYSDVAEQIAASREITLESAAGSGSRDFIDILRLFFYGIMLLAIVVYLKQKFYRKKA